MVMHTGAANSITVVASYENVAGELGRITSKIGDTGASIVAVDLNSISGTKIERQFTINTASEEHARQVVSAISEIKSVTIKSTTDSTFQFHMGGKIAITNRYPVVSRDDISKAYTPGVARISREIHKNPASVSDLTIAGNTVAVVSDGSAVLGLGNIGAKAAMPVMEGKALLFKKFADIDAWPIVLDTQEPDEIIRIVKAIAPGFGGINLEDISAPKCFYIEEALQGELDIPVFHDDQHGTAVVVLAALINALKVVGKQKDGLKVVVIGGGAAGTACTKMLLEYGISDILVFDKSGVLSRTKKYPEPNKTWLAKNTNPGKLDVDLDKGLEGADFVLGVAGPGILRGEQLAKMADGAILFALSNPDPEIAPEHVPSNVRVVATGRSDYPNQVNNSLCFPGIFRGVLDARASEINYKMKLASALAIASTIPDQHLSEDLIIPGMFDSQVVTCIADAVFKVAQDTGVARKKAARTDTYVPNYMVS